MLLLINLSFFEIAVLIAGALILGLAIYFFIVSQRSLKQTIEKTNEKITLRPGFYGAPPPVAKPHKVVEHVAEEIKEIRKNYPAEPERPLAAKTKTLPKEESIDSLKETVLQQQKLLNSFLRQVEEIENEGREELEMQNKHLQNEIKGLETQLEKKDAELEEVKQQASMSERMSAKIEEVYQEFDLLQAKMAALEKQANRANNLALELEDTRQSYEQIHKDLQRKTEKLEEAFLENQRLQQQLNTSEDKLAEANLQRQQLQKKVQFLQDLNTDLQTVSDTNKKLQTELRRIGELESMLDMIAEERDYLLKKQVNK
jgi:DNA repair exonuclease SbcCD ATPase subunit